MAPRLTRLVTRTGDDGTTGLADGTRLAKDSARVEALGSVDELNSALGLVLAQPLPESPPTRALLLAVQQRLFDLGGELAIPGTVLIRDAHVAELEAQVASLNALLPPLEEFVLPGGGPAAAACHFARTVCRRAERRGWALAHTASAPARAARQASPRRRPAATATASAAVVNAAALRFLNRLSDLLFVLARLYARAAGSGEVLWQHKRGR